MIAMSKYEMVTYLKDYADLNYLIMNNPNVSIKTLFDRDMKSKFKLSDDSSDYYTVMRRVFLNYCALRKFSYVEDFLLNRDNFIDDKDLDEIIPENTYSTNMSNLSKKKLLQLIRNTFNHNTSDIIDRFKMSVNGKRIEIELLDGPVKIKFDMTKLGEVYNNMVAHRKNSLNLGFDIPDDFDINSNDLFNELGKIKFVHYYFSNQLSRAVIDKLNKINRSSIPDADDIDKRSEAFHKISSAINPPIKYDLTDDQKNKLVSYIQHYKSSNPDFSNIDKTQLMYYILMKVIPVPGLKVPTIDNQMIYCAQFLEDDSISYDDIIKKIPVFINARDLSEYNDIDFETALIFKFRKLGENLNLYRDVLHGETLAGFPIITYIDAVITHCCKEKTINIDGVDYEVEKLRNSFVHGRWYLSTDKCLMMFDADPKNINDYDLEFVGRIEVGPFEQWADSYVHENILTLDVKRGTNR